MDVTLARRSSSTMHLSKEQKTAAEVQLTWDLKCSKGTGSRHMQVPTTTQHVLLCSVSMFKCGCMRCENKGFLPKTCKGQDASLVLSARGKALDSLCHYWKHSTSHCHMCGCECVSVCADNKQLTSMDRCSVAIYSNPDHTILSFTNWELVLSKGCTVWVGFMVEYNIWNEQWLVEVLVNLASNENSTNWELSWRFGSWGSSKACTSQ